MVRQIEVHTVPSSYLKAAKFEEKNKQHNSARAIYERALAELGKDALNENLFIAFCRFEIRMRNYKAAKTLFKYALEVLSPDSSKRL